MKYDNDVSLALVRMLDAFSNSEKRAVCEAREIISRYNKLGPNARRVLLALAERLVVGIPHGDFDKPHDWDKESSEEALDLAVYQAAKLLGLGGAPARSSPELEDGAGGYEYFNRKKYVRYHENSSSNLRVTLVDDDGRTPDGRPWVPPAGARVRVVSQPSYGKGLAGLVIEGRTLTVTEAEKRDSDFADIGFDEHKFGQQRHCRVVPA